MLRQYLEIKSRYQDAILFYRMGDFYEMFFEDAEIASRILEITLTSRDKNKEDRIPMCGVPFHAAESYLTRLVQAGFRVAVCEQTEDPAKAKGLVRREVVRVLTPGLLTSEGSISAKANNYLASLSPGKRRTPWGLSLLDLSTGEFRVTELGDEEEALTELFRLEPAEILLPEEEHWESAVARIKQVLPGAFLSRRPGVRFRIDRAGELLKEHFGVVSLKGFGLSGMEKGVGAAGALLAYVQETQKGDISHVRHLRPYHLSNHLLIDEATKRNLELISNCLDQGRKYTLLDVLDHTVTPMGARLLKHWILYPLLKLSSIEKRLSGVEGLKDDPFTRKRLRKSLLSVYDLERLTARTVLGSANGRDLLALKHSLAAVPGIKEALSGIVSKSHLLRQIHERLDPLHEIVELIGNAVREDCPAHLREGRLIRDGFDAELDELRTIQRDGRTFIAALEARERERTGIASLKVGFNKVFGYFLEVSKVHQEKVPEDFIRKQTLVSAERYITSELKEIEAKILSAQERRLELEYELFQKVRRRVAAAGSRIQDTAFSVARLDCLVSLAEAAECRQYARPELHEGDAIHITKGRHPVVELTLGREGFVPNDVKIDHEEAQLLIITGPNMAGKSTVLRQTALIVLMAHMGSFVPAEHARIGVVDQIFTRVGATDFLARGQSTFMVEMSETANILNNATGRSLVILDEIGRGTSTFDGLSIAWAVAEHLLKKNDRGVKTLFATHYHELTELAETHAKVRNLHIAVKECDDQIVFLRRLVEGATNRSYGIQVASLAGVPAEVTGRAREILARIERGARKTGRLAPKPAMEREAGAHTAQMPLPIAVEQDSILRRKLISLDINKITPLEALNWLDKLKSIAKKG